MDQRIDASSVRYAGVPERLVAYALDMGLVVTASLAVGALTAIVMLGAPWWAVNSTDPAFQPGGAERHLAYDVVNSLVNLGIEVAYFVALWTGRKGATFGMRLLRIRVADAATGTPLARRAALRRWAAMGSWIPYLVMPPVMNGDLGVPAFFGWLVLMIAITLRSGTRQGLHDRFAGTVVVEPARRTGHPLAVGCLALLGVVLAIAIALGLAGFWNTLEAARLAP